MDPYDKPLHKNASNVLLYIFICTTTIALGALIFVLLRKDSGTDESQENLEIAEDEIDQDETAEPMNTDATTRVRWDFIDDVWTPSATPPACEENMLETLEMPVDISKVTNLLYPGQFRGTDFKAHGGFRFNTSASEDIVVTAPFNGTIYRGAQYFGDDGVDVQYWFDIINDCGIMYRFDHLTELTEPLKSAVSVLPDPKINDSRSYDLAEPIEIKKRDILATAVGFKTQNNIFLDFGLYDLRESNGISIELPAENYTTDAATDLYGLCWVDFLPEADKDLLYGLPTGKEGTGSEYCK